VTSAGRNRSPSLISGRPGRPSRFTGPSAVTMRRSCPCPRSCFRAGPTFERARSRGRRALVRTRGGVRGGRACCRRTRARSSGGERARRGRPSG
jgi:hypothetical protein